MLFSDVRTNIAGIDTLHATNDQAVSGQSVTLRLRDDVDVSRGDLIADVEHAPEVTREVTATVCWMATGTLHSREKLLLKHTTRTVKAIVDGLDTRLDINTLERDGEASDFEFNEVGTISLRPVASSGGRRLRHAPGDRVIHTHRPPRATPWVRARSPAPTGSSTRSSRSCQPSARSRRCRRRSKRRHPYVPHG